MHKYGYFGYRADAYAFIRIFTSYDNPKGNADTERVIRPDGRASARTIKEEIIWLNEFSSFEEAKEKIGKWIEIDYNKLYVHSGLGYMSPEEFEGFYQSQISLLQIPPKAVKEVA